MANTMTNLVEKKINSLEILIKNNEEITEEDISKVNNMFNNLVKNDDNIDKNIKEDFENRIAILSNSASKNLPSIDNENLSDKKYFKINKGTVKKIAAALTLGTALTVAGFSLKGCSKTVEPVNVEAYADDSNDIEVVKIEQKDEVKKIISENLTFDPNENLELVNRMIDFISDALGKGIPVKDVMNEEEIALAEKNEESLMTIEQLMDFYMVMNIEDIDPVDYARLGYTTKTAETITDNYMYCARIFMTDSLTAKVSDEIDYRAIIADKDSSEQVQKFVNYLARYNDSAVSEAEIQDYIVSNYINRDANLYSMSANEFVYRLMFDADMISNNKIIPKDVNIILNEDGKINCDIKKEDGIKNKTEKAEEFTSIYNTVKEKLEISREFIDQDLSNVSDEERKSGVELEQEIKNEVLKLNVRYNANSKFTVAKGATVAPAKGSTTNTTVVTGVSPSTGKTVNVSSSEMAKYGAKTISEYENNKKAAFDAAAKADPNHTIKNSDGQVVVSGSQVDTAQYNSGYQAGYYAGNNKQSSNPGSSNASYIAGYNAGYQKGLADRKELDQSYQKQEQTYFESIDEQTVNKTETIIEKPYTGEVVMPQPITPEIQQPSVQEPIIEQPVVQQPVESHPTQTTEFVPVDGGSEVTETIEVIDYVSSLKNFRNMLVASTNIEESKSFKM